MLWIINCFSFLTTTLYKTLIGVIPILFRSFFHIQILQFVRSPLLYNYKPIMMTLYPFTHLSIHLFVYPSVDCWSICPSLLPCTHPSIHPSVCLSVCVSIHLSVFLSIRLHTVIVISCSISMVSTVVNLESGMDVPMSRINKSIVTTIKMTIRRIQSLIAWI